jgi:hypothetical protein
MISATLDLTQFKGAMKQLYRTIPIGLADLNNQTAYDVAGKALEDTEPHDRAETQSKRVAIKAYLNDYRVVDQLTGGWRHGRKGRGNTRVKIVNLIINKIRGKLGLKGLYGSSGEKSMKEAEGKFLRAHQNVVGYLQSVLIPIIVGLNAFVKYKSGSSKYNFITRWPGSTGAGKVEPSRPGWNPITIFETMVAVDKNQEGKVSMIELKAMQGAIDWKTGKMERAVQRALQPEFDKVNAR